MKDSDEKLGVTVKKNPEDSEDDTEDFIDQEQEAKDANISCKDFCEMLGEVAKISGGLIISMVFYMLV
jgi:hypothetical protein